MIAFPGASRAMHFELSSLIHVFAQASTLYNYEIIRGLLVGAAWLLVPMIAGLAIFQKAEIK